GYHSALSGVQHIARNAEIIGYDRILTAQGGKAAPTAVDFLSNAPLQPFFLSVGFGVTHRKFPEPGPAEDARYCLPPAPLPDTPETRQDMAAFKASAHILDQNIGDVLESLDKSGLAENTLVICTTDHGVAFPGMKCNLTDHGIGVMLIMRGPGGFTGGRVCDAMVSHIDIFPTICDLLEIEPPQWLQGNSMMPLIKGETDEINDEIFAEVTYHAAYEPQRAIRTRRWKYIRRFDERTVPVLPNCDDSPSKDVWLKYGWRERPVPQEQLYDLIFDQNETCNLVENSAMAEVLDEMRARLERWMRATDDPLLNGPVPAPSGARFNDPDGLSPSEEPRTAP
ncbi:MAG: sulfatase, partial [Candidatus Poribacteria bacterium]